MIRSLLVMVAVMSLWADAALGAAFNHAEHLTYIEDSPCSTCHSQAAESIVPDKGICLECHEQEFIDEVELPGLKTHGPLWVMNHRPAAKSEGPDCAVCHRQDFCLDCHKAGFADEQGDFGNHMVNVHRADFHVTHPIGARTNPQLCSGCHEPQFCNECHNQFAPADLAILSHRRGWSNITAGSAGPAHAQFGPESCQNCHVNSVLPSHEWSNSHAREARKNLATCQSCHPEGDICLTCHSATSGLRVNPHPADWDDIKGRLERASDGRTCRKCH